jgi:hypothetical protein
MPADANLSTAGRKARIGAGPRMPVKIRHGDSRNQRYLLPLVLPCCGSTGATGRSGVTIGSVVGGHRNCVCLCLSDIRYWFIVSELPSEPYRRIALADHRQVPHRLNHPGGAGGGGGRVNSVIIHQTVCGFNWLTHETCGRRFSVAESPEMHESQKIFYQTMRLLSILNLPPCSRFNYRNQCS